MTCYRCNSDWFWQKLGRCRRCMWLSLLLAPGASLGWWLGDTPHSVEGIAWQVVALSGWGLCAAHLLREVWLRRVRHSHR